MRSSPMRPFEGLICMRLKLRYPLRTGHFVVQHSCETTERCGGEDMRLSRKVITWYGCIRFGNGRGKQGRGSCPPIGGRNPIRKYSSGRLEGSRTNGKLSLNWLASADNQREKPIRNFSIDSTMSIWTSIVDTDFADPVSKTPSPQKCASDPPPPHIQGKNMNKNLDKIWPKMLKNKANSAVSGPYFCSYVCLVCGGRGFKMIPRSPSICREGERPEPVKASLELLLVARNSPNAVHRESTQCTLQVSLAGGPTGCRLPP